MSDNNMQNELDNTEQSQNDIVKSNIFDDNNFILLLIILFIFFKNNEIFSKYLHYLNNSAKQAKNYLDMADATLQALDQASKIPKQML